jgi:hypothetical protein
MTSDYRNRSEYLRDAQEATSRMESEARELYETYAWQAGDSTPFQQLEPRQINGWKEVAVAASKRRGAA